MDGKPVGRWPAVACARAARSMVSMLGRTLWPSPGWTAAEPRTTSPERAAPCTSVDMKTGRSPVTPPSSAMAVAPSSGRAMVASDILAAPCVVLGTREHAMSLLVDLAVVLGAESHELALNGDGSVAHALTLLSDDVLDTFDAIVEVQS